MKKIAKALGFIFLVITILIVALFFWYSVATKDVKFDSEKLKKIETKFEVFDKNNEKIELKINQKNVALKELPSYVTEAFVAVEDRRFYLHGGIDLRAILRAAKNNALSFSVKEGASTISQQLVKNTFLSAEKTVDRKMKELKLTLELEKRYSKDEILEMYLNTVYFGEGATGIAVASEKYFGKSAQDITVPEAALLAGLINSPANYNPFKNMTAAKNRRNFVLKKMYEQHYITETECENYKNQEIIVNYNNFYVDKNIDCTFIADEAKDILRLKNDGELSGYKIYTALNSDLSAAIPTPKDYGIKCNYSAIIIDNNTAYVYASKSDVGEIKRSPASAAKPWLIYAPAIEERYITEATLIADEPTNFNGYSPKNYGDKYYGYSSAKDCLSKSLNVPSVKILNGLGESCVRKYAKKLDIDYDNNDLSLALGNLSGGTTLKELAGAYLPFSHGGKYSQPRYISKIVNAKGKTVYRRAKTERQVFSDATAFIISDMLKETSISGTAKKLSARGYDICAKTGTNGDENGNKDAYCVCYTPDFTVAVWLGNADNSYMDNKISGGTYPTSICADILDELYQGKQIAEFHKPADVDFSLIDEYEYDNNAEIYLANDKSESLGFYFLKGTEPRARKTVTPDVKDYKIHYNKRNISISVKTDVGVYYIIKDDEDNTLYDSYRQRGGFRYDNLSDGENYTFYLQPYVIEGNKIVYGNTIKLPTVKTEGRGDRIEKINDEPWWED